MFFLHDLPDDNDDDDDDDDGDDDDDDDNELLCGIAHQQKAFHLAIFPLKNLVSDSHNRIALIHQKQVLNLCKTQALQLCNCDNHFTM